MSDNRRTLGNVKGDRRQRLIAALEAAAVAHGFELVDVELGGTGGARVVRVLLDRPGGLGIDDLSAANLWVDAIVEGDDPYAGGYALEVSSPGIDRPLRTLEHFARFVGEDVKLVTEPIDGRGAWTGRLAGVEGANGDGASGDGSDGSDGSDGNVLLVIDKTTWRIPYGKIKKAHVKGRVDFRQR
jgi:ribosome maturation factor RimP